jgi:hypothetical protein
VLAGRLRGVDRGDPAGGDRAGRVPVRGGPVGRADRVLTIAFADVHGTELRHANTLSAAAQQTAMGLGVALAAVGLRLGGAVSGVLPGGVDPITAYRVDFALLALLALLAAVDAVALRRGTGDAIRSRREPAATGAGRPAAGPAADPADAGAPPAG